VHILSCVYMYWVQRLVLYIYSSHNHGTYLSQQLDFYLTFLYSRSSTVITLSRPLTSSKLIITNRTFRYASLYFGNKLPLRFRQPHCLDQSPQIPPCSVDFDVISSFSPSQVHLSHYPLLLLSFTQNSKVTYFTFTDHFRRRLFYTHRTDFMDFWTWIIGF